MIDAVLFDGRSARPRPVRISLSNTGLVVADDQGVVLRQPLERIRVQEPLKNAPQRIELGGGAVLEVADKAGLQRLLADARIGYGPIVSAQRSWAIVAACLFGLVALIWFGYRWVLPWSAEHVVGLLPTGVERTIGEQAWPQMDREMFTATTLDEARQKQLRARLAAVAAATPSAPEWQLEFRSSRIGPNAFALPGGRIVVTDQLIAKAGSDDAIVGVLAHELGHVARRHSLRQIVQSLAVSAVISLWLGDVSSVIVAIPATLANLSYSRDFENEADAFAISAMQRVGSSTAPMADLLQALEADRGEPGAAAGGWMSTHPVTADRISRLRAGASATAR